MFVDSGQVEYHSVLTKLFYFLTSLGHNAVMVFFVLSGYLVGGAVLKRGRNFSFSEYAIARLSRLWTVLVPALLLTLAIDSVTARLCPGVMSGAMYELWCSGPSDNYSNSLLTFVANALFLQTITSPVFGSNGPLWSLSNEFWYYVTFPLLMLAFTSIRARDAKTLALNVCVLGAIFVFLPIGIWIGFVVWLLGVVAWGFHAHWSKIRSRKPIAVLCATSLFLASLVGQGLGWCTEIASVSDLWIGASFALLLIVVDPRAAHTPKWLAKISIVLSEISYSLYLLHFPLVVLFAGIFFSEAQLQPTFASLLCFSLALTVIILLSMLFWFCCESRTPQIRTAVTGLTVQLRQKYLQSPN